MKIFSIYKATNRINGKIYIGFDSNWPNRRYEHKHRAFKKDCQYIFHRALRKYGWDNFQWEVICQSFDGKYLLNIIEPYFIEQYNTFNNGYNMTKGGDGRLNPHSSKTKIKIGLANKGKKRTVEQNKHQSFVRLGKKHSPEHKEKIRLSRLGQKHSEETKRKIGNSIKMVTTNSISYIQILN